VVDVVKDRRRRSEAPCAILALLFTTCACTAGADAQQPRGAASGRSTPASGQQGGPARTGREGGSFTKLHALIKPRRGEAPWADLSWETSLSEARKKAAALGKPLFVWKANGDPIGCT
jgi:hypothetical protein